MRFDEFRAVISSSVASDWRVVPGPGPSYRVAFAASTRAQPGIDLDVNAHHTVAVYTPDIDVTVAFGLPYDFESSDSGPKWERSFEWSKEFADSHTTVCFADFFYRGSLIDRVTYVTVDSGRANLPWPREYDGMKADRYDTTVARLVHALGDASEDFDTYFQRAGFVLD
ncbi:hypothetical protein [Nocardia nova]|jgi:hypothetical protein